jgi:undecaprenyl diphosphate synthase
MASSEAVRTVRIGGFAVPRHNGNGDRPAPCGLPRAKRHRRGLEALRGTVRAAGGLGIDYLTISSFSAESRARPAAEVRDRTGS